MFYDHEWKKLDMPVNEEILVKWIAFFVFDRKYTGKLCC